MSVPRHAYIICGERDVRISLWKLVRSAGSDARSFGSVEDFLETGTDLERGCIITRLHVSVTDSVQLLRRLRSGGYDWPVIAIASADEVRGAVAAMQQGAVDVLTYPVQDDLLSAALASASAKLDEQTHDIRDVLERLRKLSARESHVLADMAVGRTNREIAAGLGLSIRTIEMYRARMMEKLGVHGAAEALPMLAAARRAGYQG